MTDQAPADKGNKEEGRRCGIVAIIGAPNAGKSTLVNRLVGAKVTIVSRKMQTTRSSVRGIAIEGKSQLVFIDTPGIFEPKRKLDRAMVKAAWTRAGDADAVIVLVDAAKGIDADLERILAKIETTSSKRYLVLNKVDRVAEKERLLGLAAELSGRLAFEEVFMISALSGSGTDALKAHLARKVPEGPWLYPEDELTDIPMRLLAAEVTREKIYDNLHDELPYETAVETTAWTEQKDGSVRIEQTIYVARDSQRSIVLGKGGQSIKRISTQSRAEFAEILERPVHLFLFVKVAEGWEGDPERYRDLGLEFPRD
jgi:GTP-binding protein Era